MSTKFVLPVYIAITLLVISFSEGKLPEEKNCCLSGKTRVRFVCRGRMIALNAEMARVAKVERGNFVCEFHWQQLRKRNNICSCPLKSHSSTLSNIPIPTRLYEVFDEAGKDMPSYRPGTRWCTSCRRNADKKFATKATYKKPVRRKTVRFNLRFSSLAPVSRFT